MGTIIDKICGLEIRQADLIADLHNLRNLEALFVAHVHDKPRLEIALRACREQIERIESILGGRN